MDTGAESDLVGRINAERASHGLPALHVRSDLRGAARRQTQRMADRGQTFHNPNLGGEVCCWRRIGENVGTGSDTTTVHRMMMGSSTHRSNILDPDFTELGVGVERRGDTIWVSEVFRQPEGTSQPAPAPPPPEPQPEPVTQAPPPPPRPPTADPRPGPVPEADPEPSATPPEPPAEPRPRPCEDGTSLALARALAADITDPVGEVLATMCPHEPEASTGIQR